jgi:hypothetical protein
MSDETNELDEETYDEIARILISEAPNQEETP